MVQVKGVEIGSGMPKICVPITGGSQDEILTQAQNIPKEYVDMVEWRSDYFEQGEEQEKVVETAGLLQSILGELPLLFTCRTAREGGQLSLSFPKYEKLLQVVADSGYVDLVDVEVFRGYDTRISPKREWRVTDACNEKVRDLVEYLSKRVVVIGSYHDFEKTPSREEILRRLLFMDRMGVDIPKMAVMPQEREDVICLMEANSLADRLIVEKPVITMAMGRLGAVSRLSGETFGSAVTFGCKEQSSAPGQIPVEQLRYILEVLHGEEDTDCEL